MSEAEGAATESGRAQALVAGHLQGILAVGPYRAGALILTMAPGPEQPAGTSSRILSAVAMNELTLEAAVDLLGLAQRLRSVADDIENRIHAARGRK